MCYEFCQESFWEHGMNPYFSEKDLHTQGVDRTGRIVVHSAAGHLLFPHAQFEVDDKWNIIGPRPEALFRIWTQIMHPAIKERGMCEYMAAAFLCAGGDTGPSFAEVIAKNSNEIGVIKAITGQVVTLINTLTK